MMEEDKYCICVLNITSWAGYDPDAHHYYGKLHLIMQHNDPDYLPITLENIEEFGICGDKVIELKKDMSLEDAKNFDKKDGGLTYQRSVALGRTSTNRFESIEEVTEAGIKQFKELNLNCDFISLYEGERDQDTIILKRS